MNQNRKKTPARRLVMLAAVIGLLAALSMAAVATDFLGLRQVLLPRQGKVNVLDENGVVVPGEVEYKDFISLAGYSDTPESRALAEWQAFLDSYDQDGAIINRIGNNPTGLEEKYGLYLVYTQEMADRLDGIAAKYGLRLHTDLGLIFPEEWEERIGAFFKGNVSAYTGYAYEDGTFSFDGGASLPDYGWVDFQFHRSVRGTFEEIRLNIEDAAQYETWSHETAFGVPVTLALGGDKGLILADLGDCFVTLNVLAGTETDPDGVFSSGPFHKNDLENLSECFDFTVLTPASPLDVASFSEYPPEIPGYDPTAEGIPPETGEPKTEWDDQAEYRLRLFDYTGMTVAVAEEFYRHFVSLVNGGYRESAAELFAYPALVPLPEDTYEVSTPEELLGYWDDIFTEELRARLNAWMDAEDWEFLANAGRAGAPDGVMWFGPSESGDGTIVVYTLQDQNGHGVRGGMPQIGTGGEP